MKIVCDFNRKLYLLNSLKSASHNKIIKGLFGVESNILLKRQVNLAPF